MMNVFKYEIIFVFMPKYFEIYICFSEYYVIFCHSLSSSFRGSFTHSGFVMCIFCFLCCHWEPWCIAIVVMYFIKCKPGPLSHPIVLYICIYCGQFSIDLSHHLFSSATLFLLLMMMGGVVCKVISIIVRLLLW